MKGRSAPWGSHRHKGYGTPEHLWLLQLNGPCGVHRRSFAPVRALLAPSGGAEPSVESFRAALFAASADVLLEDD